MLKRKFCYLILIFFIIMPFLFIGCQGMTPKQKSAAAMNMYNRSYDDYMIQVKNPNLTDDQKKILKVQKEILTELYSKIELYDQYVTKGKVEYAGLWQEIDGLMMRLEKLLVKPPPEIEPSG